MAANDNNAPNQAVATLETHSYMLMLMDLLHNNCPTNKLEVENRAAVVVVAVVAAVVGGGGRRAWRRDVEATVAPTPAASIADGCSNSSCSPDR